MHPDGEKITSVISWLVDKFGIQNVLVLKDTLGTIGGIILGILVGVIITAFVVKDAQYVCDGEDSLLHVTRMIKNKNTKIYINVPKKEYINLSIPTTIVLFIQAFIVRVFPVEHLQFVDNKKKRLVTSIFIAILITVCIICIWLDYHAILFDKHGNVKIYRINP